MEIITVNTSQKYDILLADGLIDRVGELVSPFCKSGRALIVTDDIVDRLYGETVVASLGESGVACEKFVFKNGEASKNIEVLSEILEFAANKGFRRSDIFLALGGGVVGDIAGLAAALYMRGVPVIQIPTTLLSAVDSSIGGKTAVDLKAGKNLCGVFKQPSLVIIDTKVIADLPQDIFAAGMGEVIKCGVIKELPVFEFIENGSERANISRIVRDCVTLKKDIARQDEFDTKGIRNLLNAGHTIAHSVELLSGYSVMHGNAVAMGLVIESRIAQRLGICGEEVARKIETAVRTSGLYFDIPYDKEAIAEVCLLDKKNKDSRIVFLLPERIGFCREVKLTADELIRLLG